MSTLEWIEDDERIRRELEGQIPRRLYEWGDLDPAYRAHARYFGVPGEGAVGMIFDGAEPPVVIALGVGDEDARLARGLTEFLDAPRYYAHLSERLESEVLAHGWRQDSRAPHVRMELLEDVRLPDVRGYSVAGMEHAARILGFLERVYPGHTYSDFALRAAPFVVVERDGAIVACAGAHLLAPEQGVGALGNVAVDPAYRGQGLGKLVTAAISLELRARGARLLGLNVREDNLAARRCYEALGYRDVCVFIEGFIERE